MRAVCSVLCTLAVLLPMTAYGGEWLGTPTAETLSDLLQAPSPPLTPRIQGPVGYLSGASTSSASASGTYGTVTGGGIGTLPANDSKTKDNKIEVKWVWTAPGSETHELGSVNASATQTPEGIGISSLTNPDGDFSGSYVSKVFAISYVPSAGAPISSDKLSLSYELKDNDTYAVSEQVSTWARRLDYKATDNEVRVTVTHRSTGVVNGQLCSCQQDLKLTIAVNVPKPGN